MKWRDEQLTAFVEVVNVAGVYIAAPRVPEIGEYVDLIFSLPGDPRSFRIRATVVHTSTAPTQSASGFGARFERPPIGLIDAIRDMEKSH